MKINLPESMVYGLAAEFADRIHSAVVVMHLRVSHGIWETATEPNPYRLDQVNTEMRELQAAVRSIRNPGERRAFVHAIGLYFKQIREQKRTHPRYQDYVASVRHARARNLKHQEAA